MVTCFVSVGLPSPSVAAGSPADFSPKEMEKLKKGKTVFRPLKVGKKQGVYGGTGFALINAPFEVVWRAVRDWESYPSCYPNTIRVKEVSQKGGKHLVEMKVGHKLVSLTYTMEVEFDKPARKIDFKLLKNRPHDIESTRGYWRFFPQRNGSTLAAYVVSVQVPMGVINLLPESLEKKLEKGILNIPGRLRNWIQGPNGQKYR